MELHHPSVRYLTPHITAIHIVERIVIIHARRQ
jgi:hypothetical protein